MASEALAAAVVSTPVTTRLEEVASWALVKGEGCITEIRPRGYIHQHDLLFPKPFKRSQDLATVPNRSFFQVKIWKQTSPRNTALY
eukprot:4599844-Amphidinium_carterae.1